MCRYFIDVSYRDTECVKVQTDEHIHKTHLISQPVSAAPDHLHPGEKEASPLELLALFGYNVSQLIFRSR